MEALCSAIHEFAVLTPFSEYWKPEYIRASNSKLSRKSAFVQITSKQILFRWEKCGCHLGNSIPKEEELRCVIDEETEEGSKQSSNCDQDSDVSFQEDTDEEIDKGEIEEEDWIENIKRNTKEAEEHMMKTKIDAGKRLTEG